MPPSMPAPVEVKHARLWAEQARDSGDWVEAVLEALSPVDRVRARRILDADGAQWACEVGEAPSNAGHWPTLEVAVVTPGGESVRLRAWRRVNETVGARVLEQ